VESVRPATTEDVAVVDALVHDFVAEQRALRGGRLWEATDGRALTADGAAARLIDDVDALVLLGCIDTVPVGVLLAGLTTAGDGPPLASVLGIYVEPGCRAVGVGSALLDAALVWAAEHRCRGIDATVLPGNRDGKNFFEMHGLAARAIRVHRPLTSPVDVDADAPQVGEG
jgi:ribosomal protein S18 acetylase RimI-like enzyme